MNKEKIKIALVRGSYLNAFEGQNYDNRLYQRCEITGISSLKSIHQDLPFDVIRLPSLTDYLGISHGVKIIANRTFGDVQVLFGLSRLAPLYDIFHTADPHYYYSYQLAKLRSQNKIKYLLVTSWETIPFNNETVTKKKAMKRFVLQYADHFLCYTEKAKECLIAEGVISEKISVIRLGVDLKMFQIPISKSQSPNKLQLSNNQFPKTIQILFVGRLVEEKGVMELYEGFKHITCNMKHVTLKIIGEGQLKNKLLKKIKKDNLGKFITIEQKKYEEMPKIYRKADIFILPSKQTKTWEEQYGMVLVEAMASGVPIVAYNTGSIPEVVDNAGVYVTEGDVGGLAFVMKNMIEDESFRRKLGTMGRRRAEQEFDRKKTAKTIESLYANLYAK